MFSNNYARYYDLFNAEKPYKSEVEFVYQWANKPKTIFDIGCGNGRYWKFYPNETHVLGIDKSQDMADMGNCVICDDIMTFKTNAIFDCATALFDVVNYIPKHDWWQNIPVRVGGFFIFDIWDKDKVRRDGFQRTARLAGDMLREIVPVKRGNEAVSLNIRITNTKTGDELCNEFHTMYLYGKKDIKKFCGKSFEVDEIRPTTTWQTWYKCKRK